MDSKNLVTGSTPLSSLFYLAYRTAFSKSQLISPIALFLPDKSPGVHLDFWSFYPNLGSLKMSAPGFDSGSTSSVQMPMYRSALHQRPQQTQHHPTCRCSDCHLKVDLFPRNERGTILLPHPSWIKPLGHVDGELQAFCYGWHLK